MFFFEREHVANLLQLLRMFLNDGSKTSVAVAADVANMTITNISDSSNAFIIVQFVFVDVAAIARAIAHIIWQEHVVDT